MSLESRIRARTPRDALLSAIVGGWAVIAVPRLSATEPAIAQAGVLLGAWLCVGCAIQWWALRRAPARSIPVLFSGATGRFRVDIKAGGRQAIVRRGRQVVAQASVTPHGDSLVVNGDHVDDRELETLGAAIGQAIAVLAVGRSDEEPAVPSRPGRPDGPRRSGVVFSPLKSSPTYRPRVSAMAADAPHRPAPAAGGKRAGGVPRPGSISHQAGYRPLVSVTRRHPTAAANLSGGGSSPAAER